MRSIHVGHKGRAREQSSEAARMLVTMMMLRAPAGGAVVPGASDGVAAPSAAERLKRSIGVAAFQFTGVRRRLPAYLRNLRAAGSYQLLSEEALRASRRSDTVFVCGSGSSVNDVTPAEWRAIEAFDVVSFREFPRQCFVRADYHVTAEVDDLDEYAARLRTNARYASAIFVVQKGWPAESGNNLVGRRLLPFGARLFRFTRTARGYYAPPSHSFDRGLVHGFNSSISVTNFAYLMGWRRIVLLGVDLRSKSYFWLPPEESRPYEKPGLTASSPFANAEQTRDMLGEWGRLLRAEGRSLSVFSTRSLLAEALPVFDRAELERATA